MRAGFLILKPFQMECSNNWQNGGSDGTHFLQSCKKVARKEPLASCSRSFPARPMHGMAAGWSATLDPTKGWESRVDGRRLISPTVFTANI